MAKIPVPVGAGPVFERLLPKGTEQIPSGGHGSRRRINDGGRRTPTKLRMSLRELGRNTTIVSVLKKRPTLSVSIHRGFACLVIRGQRPWTDGVEVATSLFGSMERPNFYQS